MRKTVGSWVCSHDIIKGGERYFAAFAIVMWKRGKIALILEKSVPYILHNFVNYNTQMAYRVAL